MSNIETHVEELNREIAELKEFKTGLLRCVKSQREEIKKLQTENDNAALRVASLGGEAVRQVKMFNEQVDEIAELKSKLASAKADTLKDLVETIREVGPPNQLDAAIRTHDAICNSIEGVIKIMREGE